MSSIPTSKGTGGGQMGEQPKDSIDRFVEGAVQIFPTLEPEVEAAVDRIARITKYLDRLTDRTVGVFGINTGEFRLLLLMHRQAPGTRLSAGALAERLNLSSSAMTNRLDRLEERGLITRERDPEDRRSVLASITPQGEDVVSQAVEQQAKKESDFLGTLKPEEQRRLNALLRSLILEIEDREPTLLHGSEADQSEE
jgi:DNA-binding MarR family transcriptional regulator